VHDGWGAVVSEALMAGTPAVCSDACGAAEVVHASGVGGVFARDQVDALRTTLDAQLKTGIIDSSRRAQLASWAAALGADAGAKYLLEILAFANGGERPSPPWHASDCPNPAQGLSMLTSSRGTACA
jgi:glycosyltransferase involved in cell wall biosynthesis